KIQGAPLSMGLVWTLQMGTNCTCRMERMVQNLILLLLYHRCDLLESYPLSPAHLGTINERLMSVRGSTRHRQCIHVSRLYLEAGRNLLHKAFSLNDTFFS